MPVYTKREDLLNVISHAIGTIFGIVALFLMIVKSIQLEKTIYIVSSVLYGLSIIFLFGVSTAYHGAKDVKVREILRKADHLTINILISGTNIPFILAGLQSRTGIILCSLNVTLSLISIILNLIDVNKFRAISMIIYIITGWMAVVIIKFLYVAIGLDGMILLVCGGLFYTFGLIFYAMKREMAHFVWHIFVLAGTICHFFGVYYYVLN